MTWDLWCQRCEHWGHKQHGHLISRNDCVPDVRKSITVCTSTFSSGHPGPLGICIPDGFLSQQQMEDFNRRHHGLCFIFRSNSTSHFMNAEAFLTLLHGLITPGLAVHRRRLGLPPTAKALLLVDAWTGVPCFQAWRGLRTECLGCASLLWASKAAGMLHNEWAANFSYGRVFYIYIYLDVCSPSWCLSSPTSCVTYI